jgi:hypothetical protein
MLLVDAPTICIGALNLVIVLEDSWGKLPDLNKEWLGFEAFTEEDETSIGGPDTRTYS